jgi:hypothetical protein
LVSLLIKNDPFARPFLGVEQFIDRLAVVLRGMMIAAATCLATLLSALGGGDNAGKYIRAFFGLCKFSNNFLVVNKWQFFVLVNRFAHMSRQ